MVNASILGAMDSRRVGFVGALSTANSPEQSNRTIGGVECRIQNYGDPNSVEKLAAIEAAVELLADKGYALPDTINFHLSSTAEGTTRAPTEAFARGADGEVSTAVFLGINALYSAQALSQGLAEGIAHKIHKNNLGSYATTVCVHELGHVLHDLESTDFFWGEGDTMMNGGQAELAYTQISPYASKNKKEVVAEVFCAHNMGLKFLGNEVYDLYANFQGPALK